MDLVGTLYVFRFANHLQLELHLPRDLSRPETLGTLHGQPVVLTLAPVSETGVLPPTHVPECPYGCSREPQP